MKNICILIGIFGLLMGCSKKSVPATVEASLTSEHAASAHDAPLARSWKVDGKNGSRNPFRPPANLKGYSGHRPGKAVGLSHIPFRSLKLIGTVTGAGDPRALIGAAAGDAYVVHKGSKIGRESATLVEIGAREITIRVKSGPGSSNWDLKVLSMDSE